MEGALLLLLGLGLGALLLLITTLLCGQNPLLARTPLPRLHRLITRRDASTPGRRGGERMSAALEAATELCCARSNPIVQILFLALLVACYCVFAAYVFPMLPLPGVPAWHRQSGTAAALACLALFLAACFSDPGTVTPANAAEHAALYPRDGLWYPEEKSCGTCNIPLRPARSKHCRACNRCVARLDHHCIWLNNCVGLLNMRWFLAFLLSTAALCFYAATLGIRVITGDMRARDTWNVAFQHPTTGQLVYLGDSWRLSFQYIAAVYGLQAAVTFFTGACAWIVSGFLAFQLYLVVCAGTTTVELHMRGQVEAAHEAAAARDREELEAQQVMARVDAALAGGLPTGGSGSGSSSGNVQGALGGVSGDASKQRAAATGGEARSSAVSEAAADPQQQQRQKHRQRLIRPYHRGVWRNLSEVLFPRYHLAAAAAAAAAVVGAGTGSNASSGQAGKKHE